MQVEDDKAHAALLSVPRTGTSAATGSGLTLATDYAQTWQVFMQHFLRYRGAHQCVVPCWAYNGSCA